MGYDDGGSTFADLLKGFLDGNLRGAVEGGGCLVKKEDCGLRLAKQWMGGMGGLQHTLWVRDDGPCNGDALLLAT